MEMRKASANWDDVDVFVFVVFIIAAVDTALGEVVPRGDDGDCNDDSLGS